MFPKQNKSASGPFGIFPLQRVLGYPFSSVNPKTCLPSLPDEGLLSQGLGKADEQSVLAEGNEGVTRMCYQNISHMKCYNEFYARRDQWANIFGKNWVK